MTDSRVVRRRREELTDSRDRETDTENYKNRWLAGERASAYGSLYSSPCRWIVDGKNQQTSFPWWLPPPSTHAKPDDRDSLSPVYIRQHYISWTRGTTLETVNRVHFVDLFSSETVRPIFYNKTSQLSIIERLLLVNFFFIIANDYKIFKISNYRLWIRLDNVRRELTNVCSFKDKKYVDTLTINLTTMWIFYLENDLRRDESIFL